MQHRPPETSARTLAGSCGIGRHASWVTRMTDDTTRHGRPGTTNTERALSPIPLMQLATGFWAFKTLAAAHEFDLFSGLSGTAGTTIEGLAEQLEIEERPAEMLLTGCAALGLLAKSDGRYVNSPLAEEFLVRGKPYYFGGWVQMLDQRLYPGWCKLTGAIRTNRPTTWDPDRQDSLFADEGSPAAVGVLGGDALALDIHRPYPGRCRGPGRHRQAA
jgi:hypothetical protein